MITFRKTKGITGYHVFEDGTRLGLIHKVEHWTVRGKRIGWQAFYKSTYKGEATTRTEAVALLGAA